MVRVEKMSQSRLAKRRFETYETKKQSFSPTQSQCEITWPQDTREHGGPAINAILRRLAAPLLATVLAVCSATPAKAGLVRILHEDAVAAQARIDLLQQARKEINVSYYIVGDDHIPLVFLSLLRDAVRRGVTVRLIVDGHSNNNQIPRALAAYLMREGVQIKEFHPDTPFRLAWIKTRMHDKLVIVDEEQLITGGPQFEG